MTLMSVDDLTRELHDAVVDLSQLQHESGRLVLGGTRVEYRKRGLIPIRKRVEFQLVFEGVETFTLEDEAQVGTLPVSHFTRDEQTQITTVVGNIPVSLSVHTSENEAALTMVDSRLP